MGKRKRTIRNLDQLDKEIYRQKRRARELEAKLDKQLDHLHDHFLSMLAFSMMNQKKPVPGIYHTLLANEGVQQVLQWVSIHLADKTAKGLETLLERFSKQKE